MKEALERVRRELERRIRTLGELRENSGYGQGTMTYFKGKKEGFEEMVSILDIYFGKEEEK